MSEFTHAELKLRFAEALDVIDRLTAELAEMREEYGHKCAKCGSVLQLVRPGKHQCQYCEMESALTAELARYKQGVEVDGLVAYENYPWPIRILDTALEKFHHECVRVLVMKEEE